MLRLADVIRRHGPAYLERHGSAMMPGHVSAVQAIQHCRTPEMGGHLADCGQCGYQHLFYHSCRHRACPPVRLRHHDTMAGSAARAAPARALLPRRLHPAGRAAPPGALAPEGTASGTLPRGFRGPRRALRRPQTPRRPGRRARRTPHMDKDTRMASSRPPARPRRRTRTRWPHLGPRAAAARRQGLSRASQGLVQALPWPLPRPRSPRPSRASSSPTSPGASGGWSSPNPPSRALRPSWSTWGAMSTRPPSRTARSSG
jgi:hypothetical protein